MHQRKRPLNAQERYDYAKRDFDEITHALKNRYRKKGWYWALPAFPWLFGRLALFRLLSLFLPRSKALLKGAALLRSLIKWYFSGRGVYPYIFPDPPSEPKSPMVIFTLRVNEFSSALAYTLFPFPIIIPAGFRARHMRINPILPVGRLGGLMKTVSYPDQPGEENEGRIKQLVADGHAVVVYLNPGFMDPNIPETLPLYAYISSLLDLEHCYFLNLDGMEFLPQASLASPLFVRGFLKEKNEMFSDDATEGQKLNTIAQFFGFRKYRLYDPDE